MVISKILLKKRGNPNYAYHQDIWRFVGDDKFLFRVNKEDSVNAEIVVQSATLPCGIANAKVLLRKETNIDRMLMNTTDFYFMCRANPIKKIKDENSGRHIRVPLFGAEIKNWFIRKIGYAANIISLSAACDEPLLFKNKDGVASKIQTVDFSGVIEVKNRSVFAEIFTAGIGPAKKFGCGLLLLEEKED